MSPSSVNLSLDHLRIRFSPCSSLFCPYFSGIPFHLFYSAIHTWQRGPEQRPCLNCSILSDPSLALSPALLAAALFFYPPRLVSHCCSLGLCRGVGHYVVVIAFFFFLVGCFWFGSWRFCDTSKESTFDAHSFLWPPRLCPTSCAFFPQFLALWFVFIAISSRGSPSSPGSFSPIDPRSPPSLTPLPRQPEHSTPFPSWRSNALSCSRSCLYQPVSCPHSVVVLFEKVLPITPRRLSTSKQCLVFHHSLSCLSFVDFSPLYRVRTKAARSIGPRFMF